MIKLNGKQINITTFPDHTSQVWKNGIKDNRENMRFGVFPPKDEVEWKFEHEGELVHLMQLCLLLDAYDHKYDLYLPYLPYGRQDKKVSDETTFGLHVFTRLFGEILRPDSVTVRDPHNPAELGSRRFRVVYPVDQVKRAFVRTMSDLVIYPDKGAREKYREVYDLPTIYADKVRNQDSGTIVSTIIPSEFCHLIRGRRILIVDDICDGGATFCKLAELLLRNGASNVALFVTHGLFTKGLGILRDSGITEIFTADGTPFELAGQIGFRND